MCFLKGKQLLEGSNLLNTFCQKLPFKVAICPVCCFVLFCFFVCKFGLQPACSEWICNPPSWPPKMQFDIRTWYLENSKDFFSWENMSAKKSFTKAMNQASRYKRYGNLLQIKLCCVQCVELTLYLWIGYVHQPIHKDPGESEALAYSSPSDPSPSHKQATVSCTRCSIASLDRAHCHISVPKLWRHIVHVMIAVRGVHNWWCLELC